MNRVRIRTERKPVPTMTMEEADGFKFALMTDWTDLRVEMLDKDGNVVAEPMVEKIVFTAKASHEPLSVWIKVLDVDLDFDANVKT